MLRARRYLLRANLLWSRFLVLRGNLLRCRLVLLRCILLHSWMRFDRYGLLLV